VLQFELKGRDKVKEDAKVDAEGFWDQLRLICTSSVFVCCTLGLSTLYFVVTGVQFWATEFLLEVSQAPYTKVLGAFAGTSASAPVLGVVMGGIVVDRFGGYHGSTGARRTTAFCAGLASLAVVSAVIGAMQTDFELVIGLVWLVLFFGGAIVPGATGLGESQILCVRATTCVHRLLLTYVRPLVCPMLRICI
jgi:hypothetical protein